MQSEMSASFDSESSEWAGGMPLECHVLLGVLTGLFYGMFLVCLVRAVRISWREEAGGRWSVRKLMHWSLLVPLLARAVDMTVFHDSYLSTPFAEQTALEVASGSLPGYTFFSTYSLLFCFWIVLYHSALGSPARGANSRAHIRRVYLAVNAVVYAVWFSLLAAYALARTGGGRVAVHRAEFFFAAAIAVLSAVVFVVYGTCIARRYRNLALGRSAQGSAPINQTPVPASRKALQISEKIWRLTLIFSVVLALRSCIVASLWFVPMSHSKNGYILTLSTRILSQTVCELIPALATLVILYRPIVYSPHSQPLIK